MKYKYKIKSVVPEAFTLIWHTQKQTVKEVAMQLPKRRLSVDLNFYISCCLLFQNMSNNTEKLFWLFFFSSDASFFLTDMYLTDKKIPKEGFNCSLYSTFFIQWSFQN